MAKGRAYCDCSNYNNKEVCTLFDNLRHILSNNESFAAKEKAANKFCSTCNSFKDIYPVHRRNV